LQSIEKKYGVILCDPPWAYRNWSEKKNGAAKSHYNSMSLEELKSIPVNSWAEDDCVLCLWGTWPKLDHAIELMSAWGFSYVTGFPWVKIVPSSGEIRRGIGFWTMSASEMVLIGRRGKPKRKRVEGGRAKPIGLLVGESRIFYAPIRKHSEKPVVVHQWLERYLDGPFLELFARKRRDDWTAWGLDLGNELGPSRYRSNHWWTTTGFSECFLIGA